MTLQEALELKCFTCKKTLAWNGFSNYEHLAKCCEFVYKLTPRVAEYDFEISKVQLPDGVIPGTDGNLFHHPV